MTGILEITEQEYLIKLNRKSFNLSFIRSLLQMVEVANPADEDTSVKDRQTATKKVNSSEPDYFSSIEEK
jgi:hypothetical protein